MCFRNILTFKGCPNSNDENGQDQEIIRETSLVTVAEFIQDFRATINLEEESEYVKSNRKLLCNCPEKKKSRNIYLSQVNKNRDIKR